MSTETTTTATTTAEPEVKTTAALPTEPPATPPATKPEEPGVQKAAFDQYEDAGLNYALDFLAKQGFGPDDPEIQAAFNGDFGLLRAKLAQSGAQGWEAVLSLGEQAYERGQKEAAAQAEAVGKRALELSEKAGVDWEAAVAHVSASASPEHKEAINNLLSDPKLADLGIALIHTSYLGSGVELPAQEQPVRPEAAPQSQGAATGSLNRKQFAEEARKLHRTLGDGYVNSPEYAALGRRLVM